MIPHPRVIDILAATAAEALATMPAAAELAELIMLDDPLDDLPLPPLPHIDRKACANSNKYSRCDNKAETGHIYCTSCRLATGGYMRYNRSARTTA